MVRREALNRDNIASFTNRLGDTNLDFFFTGRSGSQIACPNLLHVMQRVELFTILAKAFSGSCMQCLESCVEDAQIEQIKALEDLLELLQAFE